MLLIFFLKKIDVTEKTSKKIDVIEKKIDVIEKKCS